MSETERASRRDFLKLAATAAPAVAVATVASTGAQAGTVEAVAGEGLRETEQTKKYYETARF